VLRAFHIAHTHNTPSTPQQQKKNKKGDVAVGHYHLWREDVALMKALGLRHYRLSIAWPRVLPGGGRGTAPNAAGLAWYRALLLELRAAGISPVVTLYHWDLPQALQDAYGGFLDGQLADDYAYYADVVFGALGDLVGHWLTFSEPMSICQLGYGIGVFAPGVAGGARGQYRCGHTLLLAHAKAVQLYRQKYQAAQGGRIGMAVSGHWGRPHNASRPADADAVEAYLQFQIGWMADPLWRGDYPQAMRDTQPDLPALDDEARALLLGSADFLALNVYTAHFVRAAPEDAPAAQQFEEMLTDAGGAAPGNASDVFWLYSAPDAMRGLLGWASARYGRPEIWVAESGVPAPGEAGRPLHDALSDGFRVEYYRYCVV
jgi:beta-glucosidase